MSIEGTFKGMEAFRSNSLRLKYPRGTPAGSKDIWIENLTLWQRLNFSDE